MTDDVQAQLLSHLIDASAMRADIENLKQSDRDTSQRVLTMLGELSADIKALRQDVINVPQKISACRLDMRSEIERDFHSKNESMAMEQRIEKQITDTDKTLGKQIADVRTELTKLDAKVDKIWIKITVVVSTIVALGGVIQWLLVTAKALG